MELASEGAVYTCGSERGLRLRPMSERDLFANFERMRREMDELFGDVFERTGLSRRHTGSWPAVDVAYASDPPRAIVTAELAGMDLDGHRASDRGAQAVPGRPPGPRPPEGDVYQQIEIERGPVPAADRARRRRRRRRRSRARYEDGMLRVELPLAAATAARRAVPIESGERR